MPIQITKKNWLRYVKALAKIDETAGDLVTEYLAEHSILSEGGMRDLLDFVYGVVTKYGEGSAELACLMYDASAKAQGASVPPAEPAPTATYPETAKAVRGSMLDSPSGAKVSDAAKRLVKQAGVDTTMQNAIRDGAEFAWVPQGDTCSFCLMLASNGWQHASKKALKKGHAEHIHANCDCTYAVRFDGKSGVKGYDPNEYKALYDNAEGDNWREKMNSMRREHYAENKDRINEQKREAYKGRSNHKQEKEKIVASHKDEYKEYLKSVYNQTEELSRNHKRLLERVPKPFDWIEIKASRVKLKDIAALTAATGDEFSIFRRAGRAILLRGKGARWAIPEDVFRKIMEEKWYWEGHSHPVLGEPKASMEDITTLNNFTWQKRSYIINLVGDISDFTGDPQDWFNDYLGVK